MMVRQLRTARRSNSTDCEGGVLPSIPTVTVMPWTPEGELTFTIFALAMLLLGTIAKSRRPVRICVARQFISMTRPSVPPSILTQSPGR